MAQQGIELLSNPMGTAAAAILPVIIHGTPRALDYIQYKMYCYNDKNVKKITAIKKYYFEYCYVFEKDTPYSTLDLEKPLENSSQRGSTIIKYPMFFLMDEKGMMPKFYLDGYFPNVTALNWESMIGSTAISPKVCDVISYLCEYQIARDDSVFTTKLVETVTGDKAHFYDPINLFCEEFKMWLKNLGRATLDDKAIEHIKKRINYLSQIYLDSATFAQSHSESPFLPVVSYLEKCLRKIQTYVELDLSKRSAREYFHELSLYSKACMEKLVGFLFYIFKDAKKIPSNFSIRQISHPTLATYQSSLQNASGKILQYLVNNSLFYEAALIEDIEQSGNHDMEEVCHFVITNQLVQLPTAITNVIDVNNWYKDSHASDEKLARVPSGILKEFQQPELMEKFLILHSQIEKFAVFYLITQSYYELAGDMGNLMLYGYAVKHVLKTFDNFNSLATAVQKTLDFLGGHADKLYDQFAGNKISKTNSIEQWAKISYRGAKNCQNQVRDYLSILNKKVSAIEVLIKKVNHPEYPKKIGKKIQHLVNYINLFADYGSAISSQGNIAFAVPLQNNESSPTSTSSSSVLVNSNNISQGIAQKISQVEALYNAGNYEQALQGYIELIEHEECRENLELRAKQLYCMFKVSGNSVNSDICLTGLEGMLSMSSANQTVIFTLALLNYDLHRIDPAKNELEKLLQINPNHTAGQELLQKVMFKKEHLFKLDFAPNNITAIIPRQTNS